MLVEASLTGYALRNCKKFVKRFIVHPGLVIGTAGLDPMLCVAIPVGHGLGEVHQFAGSHEGASRKANERQNKEKRSRGK